MRTVTLCILADGTVQGLYTEAIDLASLGPLRIRCATRIEFDNPAQLWRVFNRRGRCLYASPSRAQCLSWEQDYFTKEDPQVDK